MGAATPRRLLPLVAAICLAAAACLGSLEALAFLRATPKTVLATGDEPPPSQATSETHQARRAIEANDPYDPANPDRQRLQRSSDATAGLPADANGFPDWMRALKEGQIQPRSDAAGKGGMEVLDLDVIMRNTREMPFVRFPHRSHTLWLACSNCHPAPFMAQKGSTAIRMADIFRGQYCGMCHDRVAFITFFSCGRCHSVPQATAN